MSKKTLLWLGLVLALGVPNLLILQKERVLQANTVIYLELAPVDPRSLMQGDCMRLNYRMSSGLYTTGWPTRGLVVLRVDPASRVATYVGRDDGAPLTSDELKVRYKAQKEQCQIGPDAFFFQEGQASRYNLAKYGKLKVGPDGECVLVGLADEKLKDL